MLHNAEWIWDRVPVLQYMQFPWRCLGPAAICLALLIAALGSALDSLPRWRRPAFGAAMALLIVPNLSHMAPRGVRDVDPALWTPHMLAVRGVSVATARAFATRWQTVSTPYSPRVAAIVNGEAEVQPATRTPTSWSAEVTAHRPSAIQLAIAYFPGWRVRVDGVPVEASPAPKTGQILFGVPAGRHPVEAQSTRTTPVWLADGISFLSLVVMVLIAFGFGGGRSRPHIASAPAARGEAVPA